MRRFWFVAGMQDRPTYEELLDAVRCFLENDLVPVLEGTRKFHARVAANVIGIVERELRLAPGQMNAEWERLVALLGAAEPPPAAALAAELRKRNEVLCERIRRGDADQGPFRAAVVEHLRQTVREKLLVANPRMVEEK